MSFTKPLKTWFIVVAFLLASKIPAQTGFEFLGPTGSMAWTYFEFFPPTLELADTNKQDVYFDRSYKFSYLSDNLKTMTSVPSVAEGKKYGG